MIVSVDDLKLVLGLALDDATPDDNLTRLITAKSAWVERFTQQRFDTPILHEEIVRGTGESELYLEWKLDDSVIPPVPAENPADSVHIFRRPVLEKYRDWEELFEDVDWERNGQVISFLRAWSVWPTCDEFKLQYLGGYTEAPEDIKAVILELAANQYLIEYIWSSGTSGITSEKLGDFSYTADLGAVATGTTELSDTTKNTLQSYKRRFV